MRSVGPMQRKAAVTTSGDNRNLHPPPQRVLRQAGVIMFADLGNRWFDGVVRHQIIVGEPQASSPTNLKIASLPRGL